MTKASKAERFQPILNRAEEEREAALRQITNRPKDPLQKREDRRVAHALRIRDVSYWLDH